MKIEQSKDDLKKHILEQIRFIQKSLSEFNNGDVSEAKRMATHVRILVHDTKNSKSLLQTINDKESILFLSSALKFNANNFAPYIGLVYIKAISDEKNFMAKYKPLLGDYRKVGGNENWIKFNEWWNGFIIKDQQGNTFTRKDLILHVANTDGGAHVDKMLCQNYIALSRGNSLGFFTAEKRSDQAREQINMVKDIELASVSQIAFEVISSLMKFYKISQEDNA